MDTEDRLEIQALTARFANSFDLKDWDGPESCLTASLYTDYSDLRGTPPANISASAYVEQRRESSAQLNLHHLCSNVEIEPIDEQMAHCRASMVIWRNTETEQFTSHCVYEFQLTKQQASWKISGITQRILWNEGTPAIHPGTRQASGSKSAFICGK